MLRHDLQAIVDRLLASEGDVIDLDVLGQALGAARVSYEEIDAMIEALERAGRTVGDPSAEPPSRALPRVLGSARALRAELGRTPSVDEIAERAGLTPRAVRTALAYAQVLQR